MLPIHHSELHSLSAGESEQQYGALRLSCTRQRVGEWMDVGWGTSAHISRIVSHALAASVSDRSR